MMRSLGLAAAVSAMLATAVNAGVGPPIAYVKLAGSAQEIYLVNPDGTGLTRLYRGPNKKALGNLELKPGGGEIAFSQSGDLNILTFDAAGQPTAAPRSISFPCASGHAYVGGKDYHPSGTLLVSVGCGDGRSLWTVASDSSTPEFLLTEPYVDYPRFLPGGTSFIYKTGLSQVLAEQLWKQSWPPSGDPVLIGPTPANPRVNVAHASDRAIVVANLSYTLVDVNDGTETPGCTQVTNVQYSPDDSEMLFLNVNRRGSSDTLIIMKSDCSGSPFRLTGNGSWGASFDWRRE